MGLNKRLFIGGAADVVCTTDTADIFGDSSGLALYSLDYDASDASGNHDGTPDNVEFGSIGNINYAAAFNGSSSDISLDSSFRSAFDVANRSMSIWFKWDGKSSGYGMPFYMTGEGLVNGRFASQVNHSNGELKCFIGADGNYPYTTLSANTWYNMVMVQSDTTYEVFVNGTSIGSANNDKYTATGSATSFIGSYKSSNYYWSGLIDQVRFFTKALSSSEITTLYNETACVYTSTTDNNAVGGTNVAYYKFDNDFDDEKGSYDGSANNVGFKFGRYGVAADFNGSVSRINTGYTKTGNQFGISMWAFITDTGARQIMFGDFNAAGADVSGSLSAGVYADDNFKINIGNGSTVESSVNTSFSSYYNKWTHIAISIASDGKTATLYLDNNKTVGTTVTTAMQNGQLPVGLGHYSATASSNNEFTGLLDQVRIFSSSLSQTDIDALYAEKPEHITLDSTDPFGDSDLIQYLKFDNNVTASVGSNGTSNNVTFSTNRLFGTHSASFNGSSSTVTVEDSSANAFGFPTHTGTISCWIYMDSLSSENPLVNKRDTGSPGNRHYIFTVPTDGNLDFIVYNTDTNSQTVTSNTTLSTNKWYHVAVTLTTSTIKLFIDGVEDVSASSTYSSIQNDGADLQIGYRGKNSGYFYFDGLIDQVRIFDRALEGDEVFTLYSEATLN